jgi:hypothetical protein
MSTTLTRDLDKVKTLAVNLNNGYPRSPYESLGDIVLLPRAIDKCRAELLGLQGEYHYDCPVSHMFLDHFEITADVFRDFVATGATDAEILEFVLKTGKQFTRVEMVTWSNGWRDKKISEMSPDLQVFLWDYVKQYCPPQTRIDRFFDVYDWEEKRRF